jgi:hypothetical protein
MPDRIKERRLAPMTTYIDDILPDVLEGVSSPAGCSTAPSIWTACPTATGPWPTGKPSKS